MVGIRVGVGKVAINSVPMCTSQDIVSVVSIDEAEWCKEYISMVLQYKAPVLAAQAQGATITGISSKTLKSITIPVAPLETQRRIVEELRAIEAQKVAANSILKSFSALVKSRFVEMFGDPIRHPKWSTAPLADLCSKIGSGATPRGGKASYKESGIPFIRSLNVHNDAFVWDDLAYIDKAQAAKLKGVELRRGDVLLNITGASVARSCVLPDELEGGRVNQHVSIIRPIRNEMLPIVLSATLTNPSYQEYLLEGSRMAGATREAITKRDLEMMKVPVPPIGLQKQFATFAAEVGKSRFVVQQQVVKYNDVIASSGIAIIGRSELA